MLVKIGVVGYCPPTKFDEVEARKMIVDAYNKVEAVYPEFPIAIVSGMTAVGVLKIAYEEASKRDWITVGVACNKALEHPLYPVDHQIFVGENWGDESETFVTGLDGIIRIGNGKQSIAETEAVKANGGFAYEYDLPPLE